MKSWHLLLACALPLLALPAAARAGKDAVEEESADDEPGNALEIGLRGSGGREANTRDFDWGPTVSYTLLTSRKQRSNRYKYELEISYNDALTKFRSANASESTRVHSAEFRYAKISLLELRGFDLKKRIGIVPYLSGGIQYVDSLQNSTTYDEDLGQLVSESLHERYWSPTFGAGAEIAINKRMTMALDYNQNTASGDRKVTRLSLELKVAVFGAD